MKIFDCFMYMDEEVVLDLRLHVLDEYVDYFVIVESLFNHRGEKRKLKFNLNKYKNDKLDNKILIEINSEYKKTILSNDSTGEVTNYRLETKVVILIKNTNKVINIYENSIMKNMSDKFEEERYERSIKQNFASSITNKLISELIIN